MSEPGSFKALRVISLPIIVGLFYLTASSHFAYTPDETYVYLRFAGNIAGGLGVSFNPGEPGYGLTSPLWVLAIAAGARLGIDPYIAAKGLDLVFAGGAVLVFALLAFEMSRDVALSICATIAFSVNAWLLRWAGTGTEASASVLLVLTAVLFCLRNEYALSMISTALLTLLRPEAVVLAVIIIADLFINSHSARQSARLSLKLLGLYALLISPWLVYEWIKFGSVWPGPGPGNTGLDFSADNRAGAAERVIAALTAADGCALVVLAVSAAVLVAGRRVRTAPQTEGSGFFAFRQSFASLCWMIIIPVLCIFTGAGSVSRCLLLAMPFTVLLAFSFAARAVSLIPARYAGYAAVFVLTGAIMLQNQLFYVRTVLPDIRAFEAGVESCLVPIGDWFRQNTPSGTSILTGDIGTIGYHADRKVYDAAGLVTPAFRTLLRSGLEPYEIIGTKQYRSICSPDFIVDRSNTVERLRSDPSLIPVLTRPFYQRRSNDTEILYYTVYKVKTR